MMGLLHGGSPLIVGVGTTAFALTCTAVVVKRFGLWARWVGRRTAAYRRALILLVDGNPHVDPPVPPLPHRLDTHDKQLAALSGDLTALRELCAELLPNSGKSFRDEYRRDQKRIAVALEELGRHVDPGRRDPAAH